MRLQQLKTDGKIAGAGDDEKHKFRFVYLFSIFANCMYYLRHKHTLAHGFAQHSYDNILECLHVLVTSHFLYAETIHM